MATRRERVVLDLEDNFTAGVARAAAAAGVLDAALNDLDGSGRRSSTSLDKTTKSTESLGGESRRTGADIDKYSGRLRVLTDVALTLGPALIPIGASAIPAITAGLAGLGAAAGGLGVTLLAVQGIGDGLKALDKYQLEPTAANLHAMRLEFDKLGPSGEEFVRFIDDLEPKLSQLQALARTGLFPGVEDGIAHLMERLPEVKRIIYDIAQGMGDLAREAGTSLASDKFTPFFDYLKTDARPTLEAFAHATGNVIEGLANLFVAFAPLNRDFTRGLEGATEAFAQWSRGLDQNQGFQDFLQYIRESGPQVAALLGALASAFVGIIKAAAPMGQVVVPALTAIAKAFAAIANSPIGGPLYTAAAGLIAFNRAASLSGNLADKLAASFTSLGGAAESTKGKLANIGLAAGAAALALGTVSDAQQILDSRSRSGDTIDATVKSLQDLEDTVSRSNLGKYAQDLHIDLPRLTQDLAENGAAGEYVQQVQKQLEGSSHGVGAAFNALAGNILPFYTASADKAYDANKDLGAILGHVGDGLGKTKGLFGGVIDELNRATDAAHDLSGALAELNGWFDKRQAVRDYRDAVKELAKGLKDGFGRKDVENLDAAGRSILQVAQNIKDPKLQRDFLQNARQSLAELAGTAGPKAAAAIQRVIDKMDDSHLTHPPKPKLDVDTKAADSAVNGITIKLRKTGQIVVVPKVDANTAAANAKLNSIQTFLARLNGQTATSYINVVTRRYNLPAPKADGGLITGPGGPRDDVIPALLSNREYVMKASAVEKYGVAMMDAINAERFADGGSTGDRGKRRPTTHATLFTDQALADLLDSAHSAAQALKVLKKQLDEQQKVYDKAKQARDAARSNRDNLASTITQGLMGDSLFAEIAGTSGSPWAAGATGSHAATPQDAIAAANARKDRANRFIAALNTLKQKGVTGAALQEILSEGLEATEAMAAADATTLSTFSTSVNEANSALAAAGLAGGNAVFGQDVKATQHAFAEANKTLHEIKQAIKDAEKANDKAHEKNAKDVKDGVNGAASNGHRRGKH